MKSSLYYKITHLSLSSLLWTALIVGSLLSLMPMYIMVVMALKTADEVKTSSPWAWPTDVTWQNFALVWTHPQVSFIRLFLNTLILSTLSTVGQVLSCAVVAYPFARLEFRGRDRLFILLLCTMMLPGAVTMIPSYQLWAYLGWINTWYPLWVPAFFAGAFFVFLLRQFLLGIPREMDEAATIDGANEFLIFWRILLPNMKPALATVGIFTFIGSWKDFMGPLLIINDTDKQTIELGLRTFQTVVETKWELIMAGSMIATIPLILIFLFGQKYFVKGITLTGGK